MKKLLPLFFAILNAPLLAAPLSPAKAAAIKSGRSGSTVAADIATVRSRYVRSLLPSASGNAFLHARAARYAAALRSDGSWPDIDYTAQARSNWRTARHLDRVLAMAKSARVDRNNGHPDAALEAKILLALKWWTEHDYQNPNWWWNQIGVPQLLGEIGNLMLGQIPDHELSKMVAIMKRSDWQGWTGANLVWMVAIQVARGCMENDPVALRVAYARMYEEIRIVNQPQDGIQQDDSFHQHGQQLYNGGYGRDFAENVGWFITYAWGTRFQIPRRPMAIFTAYLLDGEQWMMRDDGFDYSVIGREITRREGKIAPARRLERMLAALAAEPVPQQKELRAFVRRLQGKADAPPFTGNKQFWCSDYMADRRPGYFTSVKMLSDRMLNGEMINSEGKQSVHLSDGANFLYLSGDEYRNIFPVWDWTKIPGTTAIQGTLLTGEPNPVKARGVTSFDGGVSDGIYGMAAMDLQRGALKAKKAWFFFDRSYVALGAGITLTNQEKYTVATGVNQPLLKGEVLTSESKAPLRTGTYTSDSAKRFWVYHDHVGYVFAPKTRIYLSLGPQTGAWSGIGTGPDTPVTKQVFDLWIDHGRSPQNASYEYAVLPNVTPENVARRAQTPDLDVLANTTSLQAVYNRRLRLEEIAFRKPGALETPLGRVAVDHSCLLMVRKTVDGWELTAANPENLRLKLHVSVNGRQTAIELPGGNFAGSSVSAGLR